MAASSLLGIEDARTIVLGAAPRLAAEPVPLSPSALGRVLAEDVLAELPVPAFDSSAMDGFAVRAGDVAAAVPEGPALLRLAGESRAGAPAPRELREGEAFAISTGAMVPAGADAVVRVEDTRSDGEALAVLSAAAPGQYLRRAGDDVAAGLRVLPAGTELGPAELGVLASLGRTGARCARRARVAVLVTGDELLAPGERSYPGGVHDSSSLTIPALVLQAGAELAGVGRVADNPDAVRTAIEATLDADAVIICGGVSVGRHDHVRPALAQLGVGEAFWGLALKPGRPTWFGTAGSTLVFGLPGNPVSSMVTFVLLALPALRAMSGCSTDAPRASAILDGDCEALPDRVHAVRVRVRALADGWHAQPLPAQGSHVLTSMLGADALALIPAASEPAAAGEHVQLEPLVGWPGTRREGA
jgi:molybdopterin molybdotransferase